MAEEDRRQEKSPARPACELLQRLRRAKPSLRSPGQILRHWNCWCGGSVPSACNRREDHHIHGDDCSSRLLWSKSLLCGSFITFRLECRGLWMRGLESRGSSSGVGKGHDHDRRRDCLRSTGSAETPCAPGSGRLCGLRQSESGLVLFAG